MPVEIPREAVPCALCGSDDPVLVFEVSGHERQGVYVNGGLQPIAEKARIVRCQRCGLVYVNPRLAQTGAIAAYSPEEEEAYFERTRSERWANNVRLLQQIERMLSGPGRVLDVGYGDGLLLDQARRRGWECWGLEVSAALVDRIRAERGLTHVFHGTIHSAAYPSACFDAVLLINVIEHLRNPAEVLDEVARVTRPGGVVAVHAPNTGSLEARLRGPKWRHYDPYVHFYYFNAHTLARMLERSGLVVSGSFELGGTSKVKRWLLVASHHLGLRLDNGLGLFAHRQDAPQSGETDESPKRAIDFRLQMP